MEPEILEALLRDLRSRIDALTDTLTLNQCDTIEEYKFVAGGLMELRRILQSHEEYEQKFLEE
jgi:hypothetical protein